MTQAYVTPQAVVRWLLEPNQPAVRYLTLRELLRRPPDDPEVSATRAAIAHSPLVERIFRHQAADGYWGDQENPLLRLGYQDDPRVWRAVDWLASIQMPDGGWLCPYWKAHLHDKHSCFSGTICALESFSEVPESHRTQALRAVAARGAEFLLLHRLYRADHHDWKPIKAGWLTLSFPFFWGYSTLRALWVLTRLGYRDERMCDALDVLRKQRLPDGRWLLESTPWGRMQANLERKGEASKWMTLMASYVLQALDENNVCHNSA